MEVYLPLQRDASRNYSFKSVVTTAVQIAMGRFTVMFRAMTLRKLEPGSIGKCPNFVDKGPSCDLSLLYGSKCDIASLPRTPSRNYWRMLQNSMEES